MRGMLKASKSSKIIAILPLRPPAMPSPNQWAMPTGSMFRLMNWCISSSRAYRLLETTLERGRLYKEAGAAGLFVNGVQDISLVREISSSVGLPVNVVGVPKRSSIETLAGSGVRRITKAALLYKATNSQLDKLVREIKTERSVAPLY